MDNFPVRYVSEGIAVQTTSRAMTALGIEIRSVLPPPQGARVTLALYLPGAELPEVVVGRAMRSRCGRPGDPSFWVDFMVVDVPARLRIASLARQAADEHLQAA